MASFTDRQLRNALGTFATGVTIVTARGLDGEPIGMTASSFNSVSIDPPLVLWSAARSARSGPGFRAAARFAVHILAQDQMGHSRRFAKTGTDKFEHVDWTPDADGVPILPDVSMRFDCTTHAVHDGGDHWIIVGRVLDFEGTRRPGLLFADGGYAVASDLPAAPEPKAQ